MQGEVTAHARALNSLLEEHLDFNISSKLPPTITQEKTSNVEQMIKQRVADELFDDPLRKYLPESKHADDKQFDFSKSKKGLADLYEEDYHKKLLESDPTAFLHTESDSALKKEITQLVRDLFYHLD